MAASAAVFVQSAPFEQVHGVTLTEAPYVANDTQATGLHFEAFDSALGVLTGVRWTLTSSEDYGSGLLSPGNGDQQILVSQTESWLAVDGARLGDLLVAPPMGGFSCSAPRGEDCFQVVHTLADFNLDVVAADLAPFAAPAGVDASLASDTILVGNQHLLSGTASGVLDWKGDLSLTYDYAPRVAAAGVPEPATWTMMLVGFGGLGAMLRRQARARAARPA
ncbi:MAG TPA: PEPxxWA-CTERM sorting domain-containing protein [Phenylobacterium sp.]|jgi:hypothetical protein